MTRARRARNERWVSFDLHAETPHEEFRQLLFEPLVIDRQPAATAAANAGGLG